MNARGSGREEHCLSETDVLLDELRRGHDGDPWHGSSARAILGGITAREAAARPIPGVHSIWAILLHVTAWTNEVSRRLATGVGGAAPAEGDWPSVAETTEAESGRISPAISSRPDQISGWYATSQPRWTAIPSSGVGIWLHGSNTPRVLRKSRSTPCARASGARAVTIKRVIPYVGGEIQQAQDVVPSAFAGSRASCSNREPTSPVASTQYVRERRPTPLGHTVPG